jgi:hypothetical protein
MSFLSLVLCVLSCQYAHATRRMQEIAIRNDDDGRDVRYKRRKREGLPDDFFLTYGYRCERQHLFWLRPAFGLLTLAVWQRLFLPGARSLVAATTGCSCSRCATSGMTLTTFKRSSR